ncbi:MAG TPA: S8 family serine peptidase, partial [Opitutaceae bacterium]|nr:S8 family serine peptidase [Opitutaceae bacterium]
ESGLDGSGRDKRTNGVDDDGNGYVDDVHGINVLNGTGNPADDWGHGSHVAGIVGAVTNNGVGIAGVAWRVKIMACKFIDPAGNYSVSDAIKCIDYARLNGARIINASWGNYSFTSVALQNAFAALRNAGIIVTAAAGNDANNNDLVPLYPASYAFDNIVAVAATDRADARAGFSNYGATSVDLGAPGAPVFSTWAGNDHDYRYNDGTSMAAPHLAGACALLWTRFPNDTHQQIIDRILTTVDPLPTLAGRTRSGGRLNLAAALSSGAAPVPPPAIVVAPSGLTATTSSATTINLAWTDNSNNETGFQVERSTDNLTFTADSSVGANVSTASSTGLSPSTTYYFRVRAVQGATSSAYSNTASATTSAAPAPTVPAPSGLTAVASSSSTISLSWVDNSSTETGFQIERSADNVTFTADSTVGANATSASSTGLSPSATYYFRVRAVQGAAVSGYSNTASATTPAAPAGAWQTADIGAVAAAGSASETGGVVTVRGSGADIWGGADEFRFRYQSWSGDGELIARVTSMTNTNEWAKAGVMIRETLAANSRNAMMAMTSGNGALWQSRGTTGGETSPAFGGGGGAPRWLRIVRSGSTITGYESLNGTTWTRVGATTLTLPATLFVGLAVTSHNDGTLCTGTFDQVSLTGTGAPPPPPTPPAAPTALTATASSPTAINLTWTDNSTTETGFQIERSTDNVTFTLAATVGANVQSASSTDLSPSTTYYFRVRAVGDTTNSGYSNTASATTQAPPPPGAWQSGDIGAVAAAGSASESPSGVMTISGSGADIWGSLDEFRYRYQSLSGNGEIVARVTGLTNTNAWAKVGLMFRESLAANSRNVFVSLTAGNGVVLQSRTTAGGLTNLAYGRGGGVPRWLRLVRSGSTFTGYESTDGIAWVLTGSATIALPATVYVGLAVTSHNDGTLCTATFDRVTITGTITP